MYTLTNSLKIDHVLNDKIKLSPFPLHTKDFTECNKNELKTSQVAKEEVKLS